MAVVPLRSRDARALLPALIVAVVLGASVAACALAVVFGIGVEPMPDWNALLLVIAVAALTPAVAAFREWSVLRRPAQLVVGDHELTVTYPELLRTPLSVPGDALRVARVGDVPAAFGDGYAPLPRLVPEGVEPNVGLIFDRPLGGADVRRAPLGAVYRGEQPAGLVLAVADLRAAERALDPWIRQVTPYDEYLLEENLEAGGRFRVERPQVILYLAATLVCVVWLVVRVASALF